MAELSDVPPAVPRHVAIVMDGNGRWAKKRRMPRLFGHKQGVDALVRTVDACADRGIEYLTVFAFSSENWTRPSEEVSSLLGLVLVAVSRVGPRPFSHGWTLMVRASSSVTLATWLIGTCEP